MAQLALILVFTLTLNQIRAASVSLNTKYGTLIGTVELSRSNREFRAFQRIPYAKPPVQNLRFKAPESISAWTSPLNASIQTPPCLQTLKYGPNPNEIIGQEDCLYLNIYTPNNNASNLPVMAWLHGGGFVLGSSNFELYGPHYLLDKDIILVTVNYRLGFFGFLSSVDDEAPGNFGFKDQVKALEFINEVIGSFGGNRNKITIFGESAGSGSVELHMVSPLSKGLFQQAICQSGLVLTASKETQDNLHREQFRNLAIALFCPFINKSSKEILNCIRSRDASAITRAQKNVANFIIETKTKSNPRPFIEKSPKEYILEGDFSKVPWIVGVVQEEGDLVAASILRQVLQRILLNLNFKNTIITSLGLKDLVIDSNKVDDLYKNLTNFYLGGKNYVDVNDQNSVRGFINLISDAAFVYVTYQSVILFAQHGNDKIWTYSFEYRGKNTYADLYAGTKNDINYKWGVAHADDVPYLFKTADKIWGRKLEGTEIQTSEALVELWTNFSIFGDPDFNKKYNWSRSFGNSSQISSIFNFLNITGHFGESPKFNLEKGFYGERMKFWAN